MQWKRWIILGIGLTLLMSLSPGWAQEKDQFKIISSDRIKTQLIHNSSLEYSYFLRVFLDDKFLTECFGKRHSHTTHLGQKFALACLKGENVKINISKIQPSYKIESNAQNQVLTDLFDKKIIQFVSEEPTDEHRVQFVEDFSGLNLNNSDSATHQQDKDAKVSTEIDPQVLSLCQTLLNPQIPKETLAALSAILKKLHQ